MKICKACFGMFISSAALVRYVLLFEHVSACLFLQLHLSGMPLFGHVSACLFLQLNLSGMCCFLDMFRHVYFFSCTCQVCASLWTCFGMFISSAALVRYVFLFRHVLACLFRQSNLPGMFAFETCFGPFISSLELARHVVPAEHVCFVLDNYWIG